MALLAKEEFNLVHVTNIIMLWNEQLNGKGRICNYTAVIAKERLSSYNNQLIEIDTTCVIVGISYY